MFHPVTSVQNRVLSKCTPIEMLDKSGFRFEITWSLMQKKYFWYKFT